MALKTISRCAGAGHYRRFKGYDYSRGAAIFITFAVARRAKVFGSVDDNGRLLYSPAGMAALSTLSIEERRRDDIIVEKSVIMPDHVHLLVKIRDQIGAQLVGDGGAGQRGGAGAWGAGAGQGSGAGAWGGAAGVVLVIGGMVLSSIP